MHEGEAERAARLLGAAAAQADALGLYLEWYVREVEGRTAAAARAELGDERFFPACTSGRETELEDAVSYALASLD